LIVPVTGSHFHQRVLLLGSTFKNLHLNVYCRVLAFWRKPQVTARSTFLCFFENVLKVRISFRSGAHLQGNTKKKKVGQHRQTRKAVMNTKSFHAITAGRWGFYSGRTKKDPHQMPCWQVFEPRF